MIYCTQCGYPNDESKKFCTNCGRALVKSNAKVSDIPIPLKESHVTESNEVENAQIIKAPARKKNIWMLFVIGGILVIGIPLYFLFIKNQSHHLSNSVESSSMAADTTSFMSPAPETSHINPVNSSTSYSGALLKGMSNSDFAISNEEIQTASQRINNFYSAENSSDYNTALNYYAFPITKYYNYSNLSFQQMYDLYQQTENKLVYHRNVIDFTNSSIQKTSYGYRIVIYGQYQFATKSTPANNRANAINAELLLNNSYQIFSVRDNR